MWAISLKFNYYFTVSSEGINLFSNAFGLVVMFTPIKLLVHLELKKYSS